ncbi:MAG TPA: hypothetical protein VMP89_00295 [Solirubrobacteraceae bacterium]|nr:hypothetical protein [Solirubrobacteraceae bacterium]
MPPPSFCIPPSRGERHDLHMDVVAVLLGILMFAVLYVLIIGIDRV